MKKLKYYIAAHEVLTSEQFLDLFNYIEDHLGGAVITKLSENPDVIVYGGGVDIAPEAYGGKFIKETGQVPFRVRDGFEQFVYQYSQLVMEVTPLSIGICRGAQHLCTFNGGTIEPHVEGHNLCGVSTDDNSEPVIDHQVQYFGINKKDTFGTRVNSLHHQMMIPPANGKEKHNPYEVLVKTIGNKEDIEALWFPKTRCICVQWHPEYDPENGSGKLMKRIIEDYGNVWD